MTVIADVFPEITAPKKMVRYIFKRPFFRGPIDKEHGKSVETMLQSEWQHLYKNLLITINVVSFQKVCFSDTQNPKTVS